MKNNISSFIKITLLCNLFFMLFSFNSAQAQPEVYTKAIKMAQNGNPQDGFNLLKTALNADSENVELLYYTGFYLEQLKNIPKAVGFYKETLNIDEAYFEANYRLGLLYEKVDSTVQAFSYYEKALLHVPISEKEEKNTILGRIIILSDKEEKFDKKTLKYTHDYLKSSSIDNIPPPIALSLANVLYKNTEYEDAQKLTKSILEKVNSNAYPIQKAAFIYTSCAFRLQDFDGMTAYYPRVKDKSLRAELENATPQYYYNLGYVYFFIYDFEKSVRYLRTALTIKPTYSSAQIFLNKVEDQNKDKSNAIYHIKKKIELSKELSHDASYYYDLTRLYVYEKRYNEAIKVADSCLRLEPNRQEVYFLEAIANYKTIRDKEGIAIIQKALNNFPKLENEDRSKYYFLLGLFYKRIKNYGEARKAFQEAERGVFEDAANWELKSVNSD